MKFEELTDYEYLSDIPPILHCATIGQSGAGKSQGIVLGTLRRHLENKDGILVILDGKGELFRELGMLAIHEGYDLHVFDFSNLERSTDTWSPISAAYNYYQKGDTDTAMEYIRAFAENVVCEESSKEAFWPLSAQSLLVSLLIVLFEFAPSIDYVNFCSLLEILSCLEQRKGIEPAGKKVANMLPEGSAALLTAKTYLMAHMDGPTETRKSVSYTLMQHLNNMCARSTALLNFLDRSTVGFDEINFKKPMQAFWVILPDYSIYHNIGGLLISQLCSEAIKAADSFPGQRLPVPMYLLVEEAGVCKIPTLPTLTATARSRNIKIMLALQDPFTQLDYLYTPLRGEEIRSNLGTYFVYPSSSWDCMRKFSAKCGNTIDRDTGMVVPLLSPTEIFSLEGEKCLLIHGKYKGIIDTPFYFRTYGSCKVAPIFLRQQGSRPEAKVLTMDKIISHGQNSARQSNLIGTGKFDVGDTPLIPDLTSKENLEVMLDAVDKELEKLDKEKKKTPQNEKVNVDVLYFVCLLNPCGHSKAIARIMEDAIGIKRQHVEVALNYTLPVSYMFPSQALAQDTVRRIVKAGGLAVVDERPAKKRDSN